MRNNKFKVGDIVTGNKKSDDRYCFTTTDMYEGEVIGISPNGEIRIKVLKHKRGDDVGLEFNVSSEYFDLVKGSTKVEPKEVKFKEGDRVIVNGREGRLSFENAKGKLIRIEETGHPTHLVEFDDYIDGHCGSGDGKDGYCWWVYPHMLQLEVETKMENKKYEFKVGDRVRVTGKHDGRTFENSLGVVVRISPSGRTVGIEFDDYMNGHSCGRLGKDGHCWNVALKLVELYDDSKIIIYRKGNKVIAKNTVTKEEACARCHKDDTFDFAIGAKLALERLTTKTKVVKQDSYKVGDKVKIIDKWVDGCEENSSGKMDKWLGKVMTIRAIERDGDYRMVEDNGELFGCGWYWNSKCIEGKVVDTTDTTEPKLLEEFEEGKTYIFDLETFHIDIKRPTYPGSWDAECEGKEVEVINPLVGKIGIYNIYPKWCKEVEKPKYYNGKVVCVDNTANFRSLTIGKIYEAVDGYIIDDEGDKRPYEMSPFRVIEDLNEITKAKFIEVV